MQEGYIYPAKKIAEVFAEGMISASPEPENEGTKTEESLTVGIYTIQWYEIYQRTVYKGEQFSRGWVFVEII